MDLWEAVVVAFRRWYILVPAFVIGVFLALQLAESVAPVHEASATVQYIPANTDVLVDPDNVEVDPEDVGDPLAESEALAAERDAERSAALANPYSDLRSLAIAVELTATSESFARRLAESGLDADFEMTTDPRQPVLYITTMSNSPDVALDTLDELIAFTEEESTKRQSDVGVDTPYHVTPDLLRQDESTTIDMTSRTRARLLLLVVAAVGSVAVAVLVEVLSTSLKRRREGGDDEPVEPAVVWFGVPMQGGTPPVAPQYPQQPYLAPAPEEPPRMTGTDGDSDGDGPPTRGSRWSR